MAAVLRSVVSTSDPSPSLKYGVARSVRFTSLASMNSSASSSHERKSPPSRRSGASGTQAAHASLRDAAGAPSRIVKSRNDAARAADASNARQSQSSPVSSKKSPQAARDRRALAATLQAALRFADATGEKNRVSFVPGDKAAPVGVP